MLYYKLKEHCSLRTGRKFNTFL